MASAVRPVVFRHSLTNSACRHGMIESPTQIFFHRYHEGGGAAAADSYARQSDLPRRDLAVLPLSTWNR